MKSNPRATGEGDAVQNYTDFLVWGTYQKKW